MKTLDTPGDRPEHARVAHWLTLRFDQFGWESLEAEAGREGETLEALLARAFAYFDAQLPGRRAAVRVPRFKPSRGTPRQMRVELPRGCWERLEGEAVNQGIPLDRLLEHAALFQLADASRVLGRTGEVDEA